VDKIKIISDSELGEVVFRQNTNAKNYILRIQNGKVKVTIPAYGSYTKAKEFFTKNRQQLITKVQLQTANPLPEIDENALRRKAQSVLPAQLARLARIYDFEYSGVTIRKSRSRWGSCSSKGKINLSLYLLLLPEHLIEYVLLHELCHTIQMNHSPAFWALLDKCTQNKARELRQEIRKYRRI
jgi:predicted metal-dependent hydrolase